MKIPRLIFCSVAVLGLALSGPVWSQPAATSGGITVVATTKDGLKVTVTGMKDMVIGYPIIEGQKITDVQVGNATATVIYDGGTKIFVKVGDKGAVNYHFDKLPPAVKKVEMQLPVDPAFAKGAVYRGNDANTESFPESTPPKPILYGKNIQRFSLHDAGQRNLVIHLPGHSYLQVEDWRNQAPSEFAIRIISPVMSPDMSMHIGDPPATRPPANQPALDIPHAQGPITINGKSDEWGTVPVTLLPASREVDGPAKSTLHAPSWQVPTSLEGHAADVSATFQSCWDEKNLYVFVNVTDPTPMHNPNPATGLWAGDAIELFIGTEALLQTGDLLTSDRQILLGAGSSGSLTFVRGLAAQPKIESVVVPRPGGYILEAAIPFSVLGMTPADARKIRFDLGVDDSVDGKSRHAQLMWNGTNQNSNERTNWGWAEFKGSPAAPRSPD